MTGRTVHPNMDLASMMRVGCGVGAWLVLALVLPFLACSSEVECFTNSDCGPGIGCNAAEPGERGICVPCTDPEIPYDGKDNDCDPATRDTDVDGDGDNSRDAPFLPGGDCDDSDPFVSSRLIEACADAKDNDCDGKTDEPDCGDLYAPSVKITSPVAESVISGSFLIEMTATDDSGIVSIEVVSGLVRLGTIEAEPYRLTADSTLLRDGIRTIDATATDLAGRLGADHVIITVDNR